jgi:predicted nuclease of predicted toxin-antitoxin system
MIKMLTPISSEVVHAAELKIKQPADDILLWDYAKKNGFTIISKDDDFMKIVLLRKAPPKPIYLKTYNLNTKKLVDLILENKDKIIKFTNSDENDIFEIYSN